ncbi:MAG: class I SAM-dependent methyltransferase [Myxococcota bacterium]
MSVDYRGRYPELAFRAGVWREVARYIRGHVPPPTTVVELGAGYCDFINAFDAAERIAFDLNPEMARHAAPGVEFRTGDASGVSELPRGSVDLVLASNFLEHLTLDALEALMPEVRRVIRPGGHWAIVQPNFRLCPEHYFDDETHVTIFSDESLAQLLLRHAFRMDRIEPRFLPFSMKSRLPKWPILVRGYLHSPIRPNAGQMYLLARRPS